MRIVFFILCLFIIVLFPSAFAENIGVSQTGGTNMGVDQTDVAAAAPTASVLFGGGNILLNNFKSP